MTVREAIAELLGEEDMDAQIYMEVWSEEDMRTLDSSLTRKQCQKVADRLQKQYDATVGTNWDVVAYAVENVMEERETQNV